MSHIKRYIENREELCEGLGRCAAILEEEAALRPSVKLICDSIDDIIENINGDRMYPKAVERGTNLLGTYEQLSKGITSHSKNSDAALNKLSRLIKQLRQVVISESFNIKTFNTEEYYKEEKEKLENKRNELEKELNKYVSSLEGKSADASGITIKLRKQISEVTQMINRLDNESQSAEKRNDAVIHLSTQIKEAFAVLSKSNIIITNEQKRLKVLYWMYFCGICLVVLLLTCAEIFFLIHWHGAENLYSYIPFYLPVPLCAGLLWAFIYQMNRAQRQLLLIAYKIHRIGYVEQLMIAIIKLTPDVADGSSKVSHIMDNIIHEYINEKSYSTENMQYKHTDENMFDLKGLIGYIKELKSLFR